jgi:cation diffusion facilitator family transporter
MSRSSLARYAWLSVAAALGTMALKLLAWMLTGSVGLLSDALESLVNLGGGVMALLMLRVAALPPDTGHAYGHSKAEYFSSGFEGLLIFVAGGMIVAAALPRLIHPLPLEQTGIGLVILALAALVNLVVARVLLNAGRTCHSVTLEADGQHLMTDVWTSAGVIAGVGMVALSGWNILDPMIALAVALHILWTGWRLTNDAVSGLMDHSWPEAEQQVLEEVLDGFRAPEITFHAVRTRISGAQRFVSFHVLVPGAWTVQRGHDLLEQIEKTLVARLPNVTTFTHLEPIEDPVSYDDQVLDRKG